jgi:NAD dependent epimerase/dehydratase family enzyme
MLEIGAVFLRTETELIIKSRRVVPGRLLAAGFEFGFPNFEQAVRDLERRIDPSRREPGRARSES